MFKISAQKERTFEKRHILAQKDKYLSTNTLNKYADDDGYKVKIDIVKSFLEKYKTNGFVLDIGSNTSGEAEILHHFGHAMVASDINEIALSFSKIRSKKFRNEEMHYYAFDAHNIPLKDNVFDKIVAYEVLHHMEDIKLSLSEMYRVLAEGGYFFTLEPYGYNPYRRISEVRDYFRGTIEKSFSVRKLKKLFTNAGFEIVELKKMSIPIPNTKIQDSKGLRKLLKIIYSAVSNKMPFIFGSIYLVARKPGVFVEKNINLDECLICPITKNTLKQVDDFYGFEIDGEEGDFKYPIYQGIPILIKEDAVLKRKSL